MTRIPAAWTTGASGASTATEPPARSSPLCQTSGKLLQCQLPGPRPFSRRQVNCQIATCQILGLPKRQVYPYLCSKRQVNCYRATIQILTLVPDVRYVATGPPGKSSPLFQTSVKLLQSHLPDPCPPQDVR